MNNSDETLRLVKYSLLQVTIGPSLLCDLVVLLYFIRHRHQEIVNAPHNHVILCLLMVSFIQKVVDTHFLLYYLRWGTALRQIPVFCAAWDWFDYSSSSMNLYLLTWCCIERHLFIFHTTLMRRRRYQFLLHYLPLLVCLSYTPLFYFVVIFLLSSCPNEWNYSIIFCGGPCYGFLPVLGAFDWIFHYGIPIIIIVLTNILLMTRIIYQKIRRQRRIRWRRQRRLIFQLTIISALFLIFSSPQVIVGVIEALWAPTFFIHVQYDYFYYMAYFANQFLPFVIVSSLPRLHREVQQCFQRVKAYRNHRVRIDPLDRRV